MDAGIGMLILAVLAGLFAVAKLRRRPERRRAKRRSSNLHDAGRSTRGGSRSATDTPSPNGSASPGAWAAYYKKRSWLVTRSEKQFEEQVRASLDELGLQDWRVAVQVAASALVERRPGANWTPHWVLDYVVVDAQWSIQGVIELNDASHAQGKRRDRDSKLADGLERLGIPILFVENRNTSKLGPWLEGLAQEREQRLSRQSSKRAAI